MVPKLPWVPRYASVDGEDKAMVGNGGLSKTRGSADVSTRHRNALPHQQYCHGMYDTQVRDNRRGQQVHTHPPGGSANRRRS